MKKIIGVMAWLLVGVGCSDDKTDPPAGADQVVSGTVFDEGGERLPNASIVIRTGTFGALTQVATLQTDAQGKFSTQVSGKSGESLLISASALGYVEVHKKSAISGVGDITASFMMPFAPALKCVSGECSGDGIVISGLPEGVVGSARVFDPTFEADLFPGDFDAIEGDRLISGGFVWVGLKDQNGDSVSDLDTPVRMDLEFPRPAWPAVIDIKTGNRQIDVPFYAFDENLGTWKREGDAVLVASSGTALTEADMPALKAGTYPQRVYARGEAGHFSYWNIDWPVADRSSTQIRFSPQASQAVLTGESFTGRSSGIPGGSSASTGSGGGDPSVFCFDGPRSEKETEDSDQDGILGESESGVLTVRAGDKLYQVSIERLSEVPGDCGDPKGEILDIVLSDEDLLAVELCTVNGVMRDLEDTPVVGAIVSPNLSALANEYRDELCGTDCTASSSTDSDGRFSLTIPVAGSTVIKGFGGVTPPAGATDAFRNGKVRFDGCPASDIELIADSGIDLFKLDLTREDDLITWDPPVSASRIFVAKSQQYLKWAVIGPMESPTTYGVAPGAAIQDIPDDGNPPSEALESTDVIRVYASEPGDTFYEKHYEGLLVLP